MKNIYLIGPRACGKSTLGASLAQMVNLPFADSDTIFVEKYNTSIAECVQKEGWDVFRNREAAILRELAGKGGTVVACGGGVVLREENRQLLARGLTVFIDISVEELSRRLADDPQESKRPALMGQSLASEVQSVLERRLPMYRECAHLVVQEDSFEAMVQTIGRAAKSFLEKT